MDQLLPGDLCTRMADDVQGMMNEIGRLRVVNRKLRMDKDVRNLKHEIINLRKEIDYLCQERYLTIYVHVFFHRLH